MKIPKMSHLKPTYAMPLKLVKTIYAIIDRLETMEDAMALYTEVQRGFMYHLITQEDFKEMTRRLDLVIKELKEKENNYAG